MNSITVLSTLLAAKEDTYTIYVFKNLDTNEYIMCTRLPNWQVSDVKVGDIGFLEYQIVKAGEQYFDVAEEKMANYKYSNIYFINFILKTDILQHKEIIL